MFCLSNYVIATTLNNHYECVLAVQQLSMTFSLCCQWVPQVAEICSATKLLITTTILPFQWYISNKPV